MGTLTSSPPAGGGTTQEQHPALFVAHLMLGTTPGLIATGVLVIAIAALFSPPIRVVVRPFWRLVTGGLLFAEMSPWHSTWLRPAPDRPEARPNFRGESYPHTTWGRMPGWKRMGIRWAVAGYVAVLVVWPWPTMGASAAIGLGIVVARLVREVHEWAHGRTVGVFAAGAAALLRREDDDPLTWIAIPRVRLYWSPIVVTPRIVDALGAFPRLQARAGRFCRRVAWLDRLAVPTLRVPLDDDDARVLVALDAAVTAKNVVQDVGRIGAARIPDGPWEHIYHERDLTLEFVHPLSPPAHVDYTEEVFHAYPVDEIPIGQRAGAIWVTIPIKKLTPHGVMSATTGWCKTSTANVYIAHTAGNGGMVYINDPKRVGYTHFAGLPNIIIRTTPEGWATTNADVLAEMERRYELIERFPEIKENPELYFQPIFLVNDERGSYVADLREWAKQQGEKGLPLALRQEKKALWQGRAAAIYIFDCAQQANGTVFIDTDGRDQRMWRIASGPQSRSAWFMMFPGLAKLRTAMRKGRAVIGIGVDSVEEIQLAQITDDAARGFAAVGVGVADHENQLRAQRLAALVEGGTDTPAPATSPGETAPGVRPESPDTRTQGDDANNGASAIRNVVPGQRRDNGQDSDPEMSEDTSGDARRVVDIRELEAMVALSEPRVIVGLEDAATLLGMKRDAFEKARRRRPIEGEFRTGDRPSWTELDLREWRNQAPRAGGAE